MIIDYMILAKWNIEPAWLTFLVVLAIYRRQRIWSRKLHIVKEECRHILKPNNEASPEAGRTVE